jgi:hypothetical protein
MRRLLLLLWLKNARASVSSPTRKPNLLWIIADDFGYNDIGIYTCRGERGI